MKLPTREDLRKLAEIQSFPCISMYFPTSRSGKDTLANPIQLKNQLRTIRGRLLELDIDKNKIEELLRPATSLLEDYEFWQHQLDGLAIFLAPEFSQIFNLGINLQETVDISTNFSLRPLIKNVVENHPFFILSLKEKGVHLYQAGRYTIKELTLSGDFPHTLQDAYTVDEFEQAHQIHRNPASTALGAKTSSMAHGFGASIENDEKIRLTQFFRLLDRGLVRSHLKEEKAPLILAGVDYYIPLYRDVNTYPHLFGDFIPSLNGNSNSEGQLETLRKEAWEKLHPFFQAQTNSLVGQIEQGLSKGQASTDLEQVVLASHQGRIAGCFVALDRKCLGTFNETTHEIELFNENKDLGEAPQSKKMKDLVNFVAVQTILHGGEVFPVPSKDLPAQSPVAVLFRY